MIFTAVEFSVPTEFWKYAGEFVTQKALQCDNVT